MFKLRQQTRRRWCRAAFLLGCLAPAACLAAWGALRHSSWHVRGQEMVLRQSLGLRTRVSAVYHPRPGIVCYRDLEVADAETGRSIARCGMVEARRPVLGGTIELLFQDVTMQSGRLADSYALLSRLLHLDQDADDVDLVLTMERIAIEGASESGDFARLNGTIHVDRAGSEAKLSFVPAGPADLPAGGGDANADKILFGMSVNRLQQPTTREWELHTGDNAVAYEWLASLGDDLPAMPGSLFRGSVGARQSEAGWQVAARGTLLGVELAALAERFGHVLDGQVDVHVDAAKFDAGRLVDLRARVEGGPGRIGHSLLAGAAASLGCTPGYTVRTQGVQPYQQLAFAVAIRDGKLGLAGRCPGPEKPGALLTNADGRALLAQPDDARQPQSIVNLVHALVGTEGPLVPASPQAGQLLDWLPIPASGVAAEPTAVRGAPEARRPSAAPLHK